MKTLIWVEKDLIVDAAALQGLHERVRMHLLAKVGHMPHMEASTVVNELLREHMRSTIDNRPSRGNEDKCPA